MTSQDGNKPVEELRIAPPGSQAHQPSPVIGPTPVAFDPEAFGAFDATLTQMPELEPAEPQAAAQPTPVAAVETTAAEQVPQVDPDTAAVSTVRQDFACVSPLPDFGFRPDLENLYLPPDVLEEIEGRLNKYPNADASVNSYAAWLDAVRAGLAVSTHHKRYERALVRVGSNWCQGVPSENGLLTAARPGSDWKKPTGKPLTGHRAMLRVREVTTGGAGLIRIPLWRSGFWVTLKTPQESALLELDRLIQDEKIKLGRKTYGASFSNMSVYMVEIIKDAFIQHIYDTSLVDSSDLEKKISTQDIQTMAWGLAMVIWTRGFQYTRSYVAEKPEDTRVIRELLNISKVHWVDVSSLSPWQIAHMSRFSTGTMSDEVIKRYRGEFLLTERTCALQNGLSMVLHVPSLEEYVQSGARWINDIVLMADKAFHLNDNPDARNEYIYSQGLATNLRQYGHWVKKFVYDDGEEVNEIDDIEMMISELSTNDEIREIYFRAITDFIEDTTISVVAVPTVEDNEENHFPRWPRLIPIDGVSTFFTLLGQKILRILTRT